MLFKTLIIFATAASAAAVPVERQVEPPAPTAAPTTTSIKCDYSYCDGSVSWCFYWGGITSYDVSLGPVPGETRTSVGECAPATAAPEPTAV